MTKPLSPPNTFPILYSFRRCPYAMRARMALATSNQQVEIREVVLKDKPISMLERSPKGTVPVLILEEGHVIEESLDIMLWALSKYDPDNWIPKNSSVKHDMLTLIGQCDSKFKTHLDHYKYADRFPEKNASDYRQQGEDFLRLLEQKLSTHKYLYGQNISLADIAIFPFIRQFAHVDKKWFEQSDYKFLNAWLTQLIESEIFKNIMQKYSQWKEGDAITFL